MTLRFVTLLLALPTAISAQQLQTVRGTVTDTAGTPLPNAEILFGPRVVRAGAQGEFRIDSVAPGPYYVAVRFPGYVPIRERVVVQASRATELTWRMMPAPFVLPPVVTELRRSGIYGAVGDTLQHPLQGIRVQVAGVNGGVQYTDSLGGFAFPKADRGAYLVRFTAPGYGERRFAVELEPGEGRQILAILIPSRRFASRADDQALEGLRNRLAFGLRRDRITPSELARYGSQGLCDVPRIAGEVGRIGSTTTVILNGVTVLDNFPVASLCAWRAEDVSLVEFGRDICADVTGTVGQSLPIPVWCSGRSRTIARTMGGSSGRIRAQPAGSSYIIIWENR